LYRIKPNQITSLEISVADPDPESGAFLTPGSGMSKKSGFGSGMNNPDHISEGFKNKFFGLEYLNSLMRIRDKHPGSATLLEIHGENLNAKAPICCRTSINNEPIYNVA
jgi:hypothetical protein